jgi:hypothetical protein
VVSALAIVLRSRVGRSLGAVGVSCGALIFVGFIALIFVSASSVVHAVGERLARTNVLPGFYLPGLPVQSAVVKPGVADSR